MPQTDFHGPFAGLSFGSSNVKIVVGPGDPNVSDNATGDLAACAVGSIYQRTDGTSTTTFLYVKTGPNSQANPSGVWTSK